MEATSNDGVCAARGSASSARRQKRTAGYYQRICADVLTLGVALEHLAANDAAVDVAGLIDTNALGSAVLLGG